MSGRRPAIKSDLWCCQAGAPLPGDAPKAGPDRTAKATYNVTGWLADLAPSDRATVWHNAIEAIAAVHKVPYDPGFAFLAAGDRRANFVRHLSRPHRTVDRWAAAGREQPVADAALAHLAFVIDGAPQVHQLALDLRAIRCSDQRGRRYATQA